MSKSSRPAYPTQRIRLSVAIAPGENLDLVGRAVAQKLSENLGRPMVVEIRPGASAAIGAEPVARSTSEQSTVYLKTEQSD